MADADRGAIRYRLEEGASAVKKPAHGAVDTHDPEFQMVAIVRPRRVPHQALTNRVTFVVVHKLLEQIESHLRFVGLPQSDQVDELRRTMDQPRGNVEIVRFRTGLIACGSRSRSSLSCNRDSTSAARRCAVRRAPRELRSSMLQFARGAVQVDEHLRTFARRISGTIGQQTRNRRPAFIAAQTVELGRR